MLTDARLRRGRATQADSIDRREPGLAELPLTFGQEQLWFIDRFAPGQGMYNIPLAISVRGPLDLAALTAAVGDLTARHEALRTRLIVGGHGGPVQVIDPPSPVPIAVIDLTDAGDQRADELRDLIDTEAVRSFDLAAGPLLRVSLIRLAGDDHVLLVVVHHVVFDGWSAALAVREVAALYRQHAGGEPSGLAELSVQFADYAIWERARLDGDVAAELAGYWRETLDGFETVDFPTDRPRPQVEDFGGGLAVRMADPGLLADLRELSRRHGTTLFVTLMAGLVALLYRYTGQTDVVVGTVTANRRRPEVASMIGFLVNTLPIRADAAGNPPFTELLHRVSRTTTGAYAHQDLPFGTIVDVLKVGRDPARTPIFQIALTYAERDVTPIESAGVRFALTDLVAGIYAAKFDLSFLAEARSGGLWFECSYKTALFDHGTVQRLLAHLEVLLRGAVANPGARLSQLPVLSKAELARELIDWNDTGRHYPQVCVHQAFERQVRSAPDAIAAHYEADQIGYAQLNCLANRIARQLTGLGVGPGDLVGLCMPASLTRLAACLGVWKAGGGYVPLDPAWPCDRLGYMIGDAGVSVIVSDEDSVLSLPETSARLLVLDDAERASYVTPAVADAGEANPDSGATPGGIAYVIYTSGSTGQPKGVMVEHRQAVNLLYSMIEPWQIGPADAVLQLSAFTFDVSILDTYLPLLAGGRVVLAGAETLHTPHRLVALMRERAITVVVTTPSIVALLGDPDLPDLRLMVCGGEELPAGLVNRWRRRPGLAFVNAYGPTETVVLSNFEVLTPRSPMPPSFGLPVANYQVYVLDEHLNPLPPGVIGEVYIGGASVSRGYLNRPALTADRFRCDPFRPGPGRLYKSGDLCYRRPDGSIVFVRRADQQVKIRGLRIELGEIETTLAGHPGIDRAVVIVTTGLAGDKELTGYLRAAPGQQGPALAEIRAYLAARLPGYMIPAYLIELTEFPLTSNGKIDHRALPEPVYLAASGDQADAASGGMRGVAIQAERAGHPDLIRLSAASGRPPMVLIHAVGGAVFDYAKLAELTRACDIYGLQAPGLARPGATPATFADLVDQYTKIIKDAFPRGPYHLGGWSMGGVVAYEVARVLEQDGADVGLLVLLDAPFAIPWDRATNEDTLAGQFAADAIQSLGSGADLTGILPDPATTKAKDQLAWLAARLGQDADSRIGGPATLRGQLATRFEVFRAHSMMIAGYQADPSPAARTPALVVSANDSPNAETRTQWPQVLAGPVTTLAVDGDHYTFLRLPVVCQIAAQINDLVGQHAEGGLPQRA